LLKAHAQCPQQVAAAILPFFAEHPMPRVGLNTFEMVTSGADLADEAGIGSVSFITRADDWVSRHQRSTSTSMALAACLYTVPTCPATWAIALC